MAKNESWLRKKTKEEEATRYDTDKKKAAALHEELRLAIIDQQISANKTTNRRVNKLKSQLEVLEAQQESLKRSINHLVTMEQMTEDLSQAAQLGNLQQCALLIQRGAFGTYGSFVSSLLY
jgi:division protein CdvB (Snf7/Vps24/ESCRT-III family)